MDTKSVFHIGANKLSFEIDVVLKMADQLQSLIRCEMTFRPAIFRIQLFADAFSQIFAALR